MHVDELIEAAKAGDTARVREMLRASPSLATARADSGETALIAALYHGHRDLSGELADAIAAANEPLDIYAAAALGRVEALQAALVTSPVTTYSYDGWTPLHLAAFFGQRSAAERIVVAGADLNAVSRNSLKNTPLHAAVAGGHGDIALLLIERGADVHARDAGGHTPLHIAAEAGSVPVVKALLARGADPHAVDSEDRTPLARAAARNHSAVVDAINLR